ncbi:MAG: hypothetical protein HN368_08570 [Spirochaetales bacterium]|jgi:hypothetical protein|nr:hypothetical protein [Spirochaetales bacterium]
MIQIYFLSILSNILGGLVLSAGHYSEKFTGLASVKEFSDARPGFRVTLGVVAFLTGFLKLLTVTRGDVPVVGDLLPALAGLVVGVTLLFDRYKEKSTVPSKMIEKADNLLLKNRTILGTAGMLAGVLHFLIPGVLLL